MVIQVSDAADQRLEPYRAIRERDLVGRAGLFVAEGEVVLRTLLTRSRFGIDSLCLTEMQARRLDRLLQELPSAIPVYVVPRTVMDGVAGFSIHRGILAIGRRGPDTPATDVLAACPKRALVVGLIGLANHDNVGGVFRNAAAFGAAAVLLDRSCCDPLYRKAIRVSVGASLTVPFSRGGQANDMVDALESEDFQVVALSPSGSVPLAELTWAPRTALLLGAEGGGLPPEIMTRVRTVSVPMSASFDSLNVATTSGIALYEARRSAR